MAVSDTEDLEVVPGDRVEKSHLRHLFVANAGGIVGLNRRHGLEGPGRFGIVQVVEVGDVLKGVLIVRPEDLNQPLRVGPWEGPVEPVQVGEDRNGGAEAEGENQNGNAPEEGPPHDGPDGETKVLDETIHYAGLASR